MPRGMTKKQYHNRKSGLGTSALWRCGQIGWICIQLITIETNLWWNLPNKLLCLSRWQQLMCSGNQARVGTGSNSYEAVVRRSKPIADSHGYATRWTRHSRLAPVHHAAADARVSDGQAERWDSFGRAGIEAWRGAKDDGAPMGSATMGRQDRLGHSELIEHQKEYR